MFRSLYSKLAVVLSIVLAAVAVMVLAVTSYSTEMYQQEATQKLNETLASHIVAETHLMEQGRVNQAELERLFHLLMVFNPSIEIYLLDRSGAVLAHAAPEGRVKRASVDLAPIRRFLNDDSSDQPLFGDDPRDPTRQKVFSAAPVRSERGEEGYLYVILGGETYDSIVHRLRGSYSLKQTAWVMGASLLLALVVGLALFRWLTHRLSRLSTAMATFERKGELSLEAADEAEEPMRGDEIDRLSAAFGQLAARLRSQLEQLRKTDQQRRDLIANVSHDLRTPLATLQGCIETSLLKEDSLSREQRADYLRLALQHCQRLNRLVDDLFELARLDTIEALPQPEAFPLAELVQDVTQKFRLEAQQRGITIATNLTDGLPFVRGDIGLLERVLENLVENALRHTPSGGSVSVVLERVADNVSVQVQDTGCGIPAEELPRIFERFYQVDKSRSSGSASGLGLAIVKRIVELHGSRIDVDSGAGEGTRFGFFLPTAAS